MADDLRKLKDEAAKAVERGKYRRAAELYDVLAAREADPLWPHRAGEAYRRAGLLAEAVERLGMAAEGYEGQGFISKAIAVCKMILEVDSKHTVAQERLGRLGPRRNTPLMMPAVNADGVPIRSSSELVPSSGPTLALGRTPVTGVPRTGNEPVTLDGSPRTKTVPPVALEPASSRTKTVPPVSLEPGPPPRTKTVPPVSLESSPPRTKTTPPLPLEPAAAPRTKTVPPTSPEPASPPRSKTVPPLPPGPGLGLELSAAPRTKTDPPRLPDPPRTKTPPPFVPESQSPPRTKTGQSIPLEPAAPPRTKTVPPLAPEPPAPPRTKTVPPMAAEPASSQTSQTLPPAASVPARPRSRIIPPILPEATAAVSRPRSLAPPPPASLHPPSSTRTPVMIPAVPRPGTSGEAMNSSHEGVELASSTPGPSASLPLSGLPAGRPRRTTSEFPAVEIPVGDEGPRSVPEGVPGVPRIPLFWLLGEDRLRSVLERCGRLEVPAGEVILRQGEQVDNLYVVLRGAVDVSVRSPRGEEPLGRRGAGGFFGELPLLVQQRQPATVTAFSPTALLRLDRALMEEILAEALPMRQMLLRTARDRAIERLVATSPLFDTLGVADAAGLVGRFEFRDLAPGTPLITQGEAVSTLLVVLAGGCDVVFHEGGAERPVALLGPGDLVGAVSLLERKSAEVSARTRTRVWALAMSPATFREVIVTYPTVLIHVGEVAQQRHARLAQLRG